QILLKNLKEGSEEYKKFLYIYRESFHMSQLINTLLEFSRSGRVNFQISSIKEIINNCLFILNPILEEKNFKIEVKEKDDLYIKTDPILLGQALFNLVKNSCEAVNYRGKVKLSYEKKGDKLLIFIEDDGPGIEEDLKEKVFQPFFSTKLGRGTGLGLTISYAIIKGIGGDLYFMKNQEKGTLAIMEIPYEDSYY
ncbi:MAG: HAMP domain-containing sensor histidine kinase, partial [Thermoanaerobaculia bacterium]